MTEDIDQARAPDATAEPDVPSGIMRLGVEARAEYIRARQRLGLGGDDEPAAGLGIVGRYRLDAEIGRGGMGIVFRASDPELDRPVAIKLVQAVPFARYDKLRTRLLREAKVLAKLAHPNVVRIYDCGQHDGEVYLAMEYVEGSTLRDWQRGQSQRAILDAYRQAAHGLAAAHDLGITHRDFKPDNVLVARDGRVLVGDFGLAGVPAGDELRGEGSPTTVATGALLAATPTGALLGTPTYMAPEQLRGEEATTLSDQFAFCVALWEALTGVRPFEGDRHEVLLERIEHGQVQGAERVPRRLRGKLRRGLAADPAARFANLQELADDLVPRRGGVVLGVGVAMSLTVGVVAGEWLRPEVPAPPPSCALSARIAELEVMPQWSQVEETLAGAGLGSTYERLERAFETMRAEAPRLCQPTDDEQVARREWLGQGIDELQAILASPELDDPSRLQEAVEEFARRRWSAPPPRPVADEVALLLVRSYALRLNNQLPEALVMADQAVAAAGRRGLELAIALQWRGRVQALRGEHSTAMVDYREALGHAEVASYADARLETELFAARTAAMRLEDLDRARDSLSRARGLLQYRGEPWFSPRSTDYHEVLAAVLKREGRFDAALAHQAYALLVRELRGDVLGVGVGHANLGTIYELRQDGSDLALARRSYERALETLERLPSSPEWREAAFSLGHWLVQYGKDEELSRAKQLLEQVRTESSDLRPSALGALVLLAILQEDANAGRALADELKDWLRNDAPHNLSTARKLDAWQNIAIAYAQAHDLAAFEDARAAFAREHRAALDDAEPAQVQALKDQTARLDLTAAAALAEPAPERARALAASVRDLVLEQPSAQRTPEAAEMLSAAEELIGLHP